MYITVSNLIIQSIIDTSINTTGNITRIIDTITSIQMKILISLSIFIILTAVVLGEDEDYVDNTTNDYYLNCYSKLNCEDQWFETNSRIMQISNCCKSGRGESYKYKNQCYSCKK
jgi:hypothetical protein